MQPDYTRTSLVPGSLGGRQGYQRIDGRWLVHKTDDNRWELTDRLAPTDTVDLARTGFWNDRPHRFPGWQFWKPRAVVSPSPEHIHSCEVEKLKSMLTQDGQFGTRTYYAIDQARVVVSNSNPALEQHWKFRHEVSY